MISYSGSPAKIALTTAGFGRRTGDANRPTLFEEGPWVYKRNGLYYIVFAAKCCFGVHRLLDAPGPTGPWTYRGTIMPTQGSSFTNHPGVVDFKAGRTSSTTTARCRVAAASPARWRWRSSPTTPTAPSRRST
jgi:hypothetical protein